MQVQDLLAKGPMPSGGMKIRQHPTKGFYGNTLYSQKLLCPLQ